MQDPRAYADAAMTVASGIAALVQRRRANRANALDSAQLNAEPWSALCVRLWGAGISERRGRAARQARRNDRVRYQTARGNYLVFDAWEVIPGIARAQAVAFLEAAASGRHQEAAAYLFRWLSQDHRMTGGAR